MYCYKNYIPAQYTTRSGDSGLGSNSLVIHSTFMQNFCVLEAMEAELRLFLEVTLPSL